MLKEYYMTDFAQLSQGSYPNHIHLESSKVIFKNIQAQIKMLEKATKDTTYEVHSMKCTYIDAYDSFGGLEREVWYYKTGDIALDHAQNYVPDGRHPDKSKIMKKVISKELYKKILNSPHGRICI